MNHLQVIESQWKTPLAILAEFHSVEVAPYMKRVGFVPALPLRIVEEVENAWKCGELEEYLEDYTPEDIPAYENLPDRLTWLLDGLCVWSLERNVYSFAPELLAKMDAVARHPSVALLDESALLAYDHQEHGNARYIELPEEMAAHYGGYSGLLIWHYHDDATGALCFVQSWFNGDPAETKTFVIPLDKRLSIGSCIAASSTRKNGVECHNSVPASADEQLVIFGVLAQLASCEFNIFGCCCPELPPTELDDAMRGWKMQLVDQMI